MKIYISILFLMVVLTQVVNSQEWEEITTVFHPSIEELTLTRGTFIDENVGWIFESFEGRIWKTEDGGHNWHLQLEKNGAKFYEGQFIDRQIGWIASNDFLYTKDGGNHWDSIAFDNSLFCLSFSDSLNGFVGGLGIWETNDGGLNWEQKTVNLSSLTGVFDIFFLNPQYGFAIGRKWLAFPEFYLLYTEDYGETWDEKYISISGFTELHFFDLNRGVLFGETGAILTTDKGDSWEPVYSGTLYSNFFLDNKIGWLVGWEGECAKTEDRGQTWTKYQFIEDELQDIVFVENNTIGYIFGRKNIYKYKEINSSVNENLLLKQYQLYQNYPNPFNPNTEIKYEIQNSGFVKLEVFTNFGEKCRIIVSKYQNAGSYSVEFNANNLSNGIYYYRLRINGFSQTNKMLLLK